MTLKMIQAFLQDPYNDTAYLTGRAGTGKTTEIIDVCTYLYREQIPFVVCAYTHKACEVLASKFPPELQPFICTLHSFLGKRPGINDQALSLKHVDYNFTSSTSVRPALLIIDEFSMVGEKDVMDIRAVQDPSTDTDKPMKVLLVGDTYQLPPVGDQQTIRPGGKYHVNLTELKRTDKADLAEAMTKIIRYLDGSEPVQALQSSANLVRGQNIVQLYKESTEPNKKILAWTNEAVQSLNAAVMGRSEPSVGDILFCTSNRQEYRYLGIVPPERVTKVKTPMQDLELGSKYKTLEYLVSLPYISFLAVEDLDTNEELVIATVFGMKNYLDKEKQLTSAAVVANKSIATQHATDSVTEWCKANSTTALANARRKAWRECITFKDATMQLDFNHALTVHKSQGSTYTEVYIDTDDLFKCADMSFQLYLRLMYVAISRASQKVYTT